jgi:phospholipase A1
LSGDNAARLACFDAWAGQQAWQAPAASAVAGAAPGSTTEPAADASSPAKPVDTTLPATRIIEVARTEGCRDPQYSDLSRFWELESGSDCGTFSFRGYRPITVSVVASDSVNRQPTSPAVGHSATESTPYRTTENRIQLSVRTKLAQGLLTQGHPTLKDSVWFGYSQQSYWQLFTPQISRPFRSTDHEPEIMYVYPTTAQLPFGWRWRYSGVGLVHQSNGQSNPLSRSWNRVYLMTGMELMSSSMEFLKDEAWFVRMMVSFSNPLVGILVGAVYFVLHILVRLGQQDGEYIQHHDTSGVNHQLYSAQEGIAQDSVDGSRT